MRFRSTTKECDATGAGSSPEGAPATKNAPLTSRRELLRACFGAALAGALTGCDDRFTQEEEEYHQRLLEEKQQKLTEEELYDFDVTMGPEAKKVDNFYFVRYRTTRGAAQGSTEDLLRTIQELKWKEGWMDYDLVSAAPSEGFGVGGYVVKPK